MKGHRGWGGRRAGAGGKPWSDAQKAAASAQAFEVWRRRKERVAQEDEKVALPTEGSAEDAVALARKYSPAAVKVLMVVAARSRRDSARVAAASKILDIARLVAPEADVTLIPLGKKELQLEAARAAVVEDAEWGDDLAPPSTAYRN